MQYTKRERTVTAGSRQKAGAIHHPSVQKSLTPAGHDSYRLFTGDTVINIRFSEGRSLATCLANAFSTMTG